MKQQIPPAAMVAAIVVVLAIAGLIGMRVLGPDRPHVANAQKGMTDAQKAQYEAAMHNSGGSPPHIGHSSSDVPGYPSGGSAGSPNH